VAFRVCEEGEGHSARNAGRRLDRLTAQSLDLLERLGGVLDADVEGDVPDALRRLPDLWLEPTMGAGLSHSG
jgi:hypothetical protein